MSRSERKAKRAVKRQAVVAVREEQTAARAVQRANPVGRRQAETGLLVVLTVLAVFVGWRYLISNDTPTPVAAQPAASTPTVAPTAAAGPPMTAATVVDPGAVSVVVSWFTITCGSSAEVPNLARQDQARPLVTDEAAGQVDRTPPIVQATWVCGPVTARVVSMKAGAVLVGYSAARTITTPTTPPVVEAATGERWVVQQGGVWLVDKRPAGE